ncbi:MAG: hypothetical protein SWO11_21835 [Thermodesulfobacteriota bacterium]|nr:hypothetical protein [Thermodesulfobacteriota bacterium]
MSKKISAYFSEGGSPKTGLSPTIIIRNITDGGLSVNGDAVTESGNGFYEYDFAGHDSQKEYDVIVDSVTLTGRERYAITYIPKDKVDDLYKLQGLDVSNPMTVTPTSRVAGSVSQTISGDGATTSTVTRT